MSDPPGRVKAIAALLLGDGTGRGKEQMVGLRFGLMTLLAAAFALIAPASGQAIGSGPHVRTEIVPETAVPRAGGEVTLALVAQAEDGWHAYWQNPGDAGVSPKLDWTLPPGVTAGPLVHPVPRRLIVAGIVNYVHEGQFTEFVTLKLPAGLAAGTRLPIRLRTDYLVCTLEICVPETAELATELTVGDGALDAARRGDFDRWRAALPRPLGADARFATADGGVRLSIPWPASAPLALDQLIFFPARNGLIDQAAPQSFARDGDRIVLSVKGTGDKAALEGVLATGDGRGFAIRATPGDVPPPAAPAGAPAFAWTTALLAFGGAVLGGLLLNVMPCVFPILSLKALSLARANHAEGNPRGEALAYTAGVVAVCLALGGTLLALRAGGATLGWAFQLQDPRVILVLLLLVTAIALNLAGLFEVLAPGFVGRAAARGTGGAFATGALAAFVATPCTGPFMAGALGAALILPWPAALAVFGGLGLGIALPFLLLGFVPALRRRLPKPGAWMARLRRILSIPMFLTAVALAWVLGRQTGADGMALGLLVTLALALVLWGAGRKQAAGQSVGLVAWLIGLAVFAGGIWLVGRMPPRAAAAEAPALAGAEPFSEARLAALRAEGRPVFAYFTADWCLTCKVNEKAVIETHATADAFAAGKVAVLIGDWTNGDAALGRFIEQHNRAGVPLYLWYAPGAAEPQILPQILTQQLLADLAAQPGTR